MKEAGLAHWLSPNMDATNSSGFAGLPGGFRDASGSYYDVGYFGRWWSSTQVSTSYAWGRGLNYGSGVVNRYDNLKSFGFSVRCVRD